jgi:alkaline phosphatase D
MKMERRDVIKAAGGLALFAGFAPLPLQARPLGANPFTLGVASGDPWPDGFVIWTRLAPRPLDEHGGMPASLFPVTWEVSEDEAFSRVVRKGEAIARPELAHSVHVEVDGLKPHRVYWYRFAVPGSDVSPVGRARTAPASTDLIQRLRVGVGGCQHYEMGYFGAWRHLAQEPDLDLIFHYGDYIYEGKAGQIGVRPDGTRIVREHAGEEIYSIDDYRRRYAQYKSDPDLQAAHAACAFAASFDDHEVDNNFAGDIDENGTAPELFRLRRFAAMQAWYEHMPVRKAQFPGLGGLTAYRRLDYGRLLRVHVLDTRSYRSDQPCSDGKITPCPPEAHNAATMFGEAQENWLDQGLGSGATWNLLAQQIMVMPFDLREAGAPEPYYATDLWDGYRPARARLIESIQRHRLTNVIIATGDHHRHCVGTVPERDEDVGGKAVAVEFLATSITSGGDGIAGGFDHYMKNNPQFRLYNNQRGYQLFDITPREWTTDVKVMDRVSTPGGRIASLAKFVVQPEAPLLHNA